MIDGGCWVRADPKGAGERGWDARLDEHMRGDGWPSTYPYERWNSAKPDKRSGRLVGRAECAGGGRSSERDGSLQQSSDWFTPIPSRAAEFVDQFGF